MRCDNRPIGVNPVADAINALGVNRVAREFGCSRQRVRRWKRLATMRDARHSEVAFVARHARVSIAMLTVAPTEKQGRAKDDDPAGGNARINKLRAKVSARRRPRGRVTSARRQQNNERE